MTRVSKKYLERYSNHFGYTTN